MRTTPRARAVAATGALAIGLTTIASPTLAGEVALDSLDYHSPTVAGDVIHFVGWSPQQGNELWVTDGTKSGTRMVADVHPGTRSGFYDSRYGNVDPQFTTAGGLTFFVASTKYGPEVWRTDGTAAGTFRLSRSDWGIPQDLTAVGGILYFALAGELWSSDGTKDGTAPVLVESPVPYPFPYALEEVEGRLVFLSSETAGSDRVDVWTAEEDGLPSVSRTADASEGEDLRLTSDLVDLGDGSFAYIAWTGFPEVGSVFVSDGTDGGTVDFGPESSAVSSAVAFDGELIMTRYADGADETRLWRTDRATSSLVEVQPELQVGLDTISGLDVADGRLWVTRYDRGTRTESVWTTTDAGVDPVKAADLDSTTRRIRTPVAAAEGDTLRLLQNGKLWSVDAGDGTATVLEEAVTTSGFRGYGDAASVGGRTVFTIQDAPGAVWLTDGTAAGTDQVLPFRSPGSFYPNVRGAATVGSTLEALHKASSSETVPYLSYQWRADGKDIAGATEKTFTPTAEQAGDRISVRISFAREGYFPVAKTSLETAALLNGFTAAPYPAISGTVKVGRTVSAVTGAWSPQPTSFRYQWYLNGTAVSGAKASSFKIPATAVGRKLTVKVAAVRSGYLDTKRTSAATTVTN